MTAVRIASLTESHIASLEARLEAANASTLSEYRRAGYLQALLDAAQAENRRMGRLLDLHYPGWRDEMRREITGGTSEQWAKQEGAER